MQPNPYSPPATTALELPPGESPPRPIAVWIMMGLLTTLAVVFVWGSLNLFRSVLQHRSQLHGAALIGVGAWRVALIAVVVLSILSAYRRRGWSRWFGLAVIAGLMAFVFLSPDRGKYPNDPERAGALLGRYVIYPALLAWWAYAFAFSAKAKRYFSKPNAA